MVLPDGSSQTFLKSIYCSLRGVLKASNERNIRIDYLTAICVLIAGWFFKISDIEWCAIILSCSSVISGEINNTANERIADKIVKFLSQGEKFDEDIRDIKDISAGGVYVKAIGAILVGLIIFIPKILLLVGL